MKLILFLLTVLLSPLLLAEQSFPENFGAKNSKAYYAQILQKQGYPVLERKGQILEACKEEIGLKQKACVNVERISFACMEGLPIIADHTDYCVVANAARFKIEKTLTINFLFDDNNGDPAHHASLRNMFYSAVECTKAFYEREGIELSLSLNEVDAEDKPDIYIREYSGGRGGAAHRVFLRNSVEYLSHGQLCQLVAHELSHHFALPDRYQRYDNGKPCTQQTSYPEETLMAMHGRHGFAGYPALVFHEHDFHNMFYRVCPNTVERFMKTSSGATDLGVDGAIPEKQNTWYLFFKKVLKGIMFFLIFLTAIAVLGFWNTRINKSPDNSNK